MSKLFWIQLSENIETPSVSQLKFSLRQVKTEALSLTQKLRSWKKRTPDNHLYVNKAKYPCLWGMDSLSSLLIATFNKMERWLLV